MPSSAYDKYFTPAQLQKAREIIKDYDSHQHLTVIIQQVLQDMTPPPGIKKEVSGGFLKTYGDQLPNYLVRDLISYLAVG